MTAATSALSPPGRLASVPTIVLAGLAGGAVDFLYACAVTLAKGRTIEKLWQGVASGWIGKAAGDGGWATAALGMVTHFGIAIVMALTFAVAASRLPALYRWPLRSGALYGVVLYAVMYGLVLPTRFGRAYQWAGLQSAGDIAAHVGVGVLIALVLSRRRAA